MRKLIVLAGLLVLIAAPVVAQDAPASEAYVGYQYTRFNPGGGNTGINLNGWNAALSVNANSWFGVVGDFSGAYGSPSVVGASTRHHTFLFGPRLTYRGERVQPFVHVLLGGARLSTSGVVPTEAFWAWDFGGGVDVRVADNVMFRLGQVDYFGTRFRLGSLNRSTQHNFRYSAGLVFHFGQR